MGNTIDVVLERLNADETYDMGQGYYFAKPMKSEDIVTFYYKNKI